MGQTFQLRAPGRALVAEMLVEGLVPGGWHYTPQPARDFRPQALRAPDHADLCFTLCVPCLGPGPLHLLSPLPTPPFVPLEVACWLLQGSGGDVPGKQGCLL